MPDHKYYLTSQTPVDWVLVLVAVGIFLLMWAVKGVQFHGLARVNGMSGPLGQHGRAYFYGIGLQRLLPFGVGRVGIAAALRGQGHAWDPAVRAAFAAELFVLGGAVKGGKIYGEWPGLAPDVLNEDRDLAVTTDFRDVFAELLVGHLGCKDPDAIFPDYKSDRARFKGML